MKCPKCGSPTFTADIDDQKTILCTNDACKWKGAAEIGQCPYGKVVPGGILCDTYEFCEFQAWQLVKDDLCWCTREETLLKRAEAADARRSVAAANGAVDLAKQTQHDLHEQMATTIERLDKHIRDVDSRISPPTWKLWVYGLLTLIVGIGLGMWVSP